MQGLRATRNHCVEVRIIGVRSFLRTLPGCQIIKLYLPVDYSCFAGLDRRNGQPAEKKPEL